MKTNLMGLVAAVATLTSVAAFADDCNHPSNHHPSNYHSAEVPAAMPVAPVGQPGRYELRTVQKYVQGRYETVTVQECRERRHGWRRHTVCHPVTQSQWVPGGYQTVQEWVWIPAPSHQQYSQYPGQRPPMYSQGRVGFHVSIR